MDTEYCLVDTADHMMTVRINRRGPRLQRR
jgi:hypothetical protein